MSFADELRAYDSNSEKKKKMEVMNNKLQQEVSIYINEIKKACSYVNSNNRRDVAIYFTVGYDEGYIFHGFIEKLPNVQEFIDKANQFNKEKYTNWSTYHGAGTGKFETRLYEDLIRYDSSRLDYAKELEMRLNKEVSKLGFDSYKVSLEELDDIYVVHDRTAGILSGTIKEKISTRVAGKIYTFRFQASW